MLRQLMYPDHLVVTVENGAACRNFNVMPTSYFKLLFRTSSNQMHFARVQNRALVRASLERRTKAVAKSGGTINQCVMCME